MLDVNTKRDDSSNILVLTFRGEFDIVHRDIIDSYLTEAISKLPRALIIDLSDISLIDSSGIGILIAHHAKLKSTGIRMALVVNHNNNLIEKLERIGVFSDIGIDSYKTLDEAMSSLANLNQ
ncbi:MAG: STAS domain-containing protein [Firmicutes bacterium]|nr:STAS domain-containing protein [Bacillota bacterium]